MPSQAHRGDMVVAVGIYLGLAVPEVAVSVGGELSLLPVAVAGLSDIIDLVQTRCGGPYDRLAVSYPASWVPLRVDRLLRDVRSANIAVDRYLTSAEAAVRWWLQQHPDARREGTVVVRELIDEASTLTFVDVDGSRIEAVSASMTEPIATLVVGADDHAVALGTALTATL